jgi:hypothetical protein
MLKYSSSIFIVTTLFLSGFSQNAGSKQYNSKGSFYFYWGWNRSWYSSSNIHFTGSNYDFTLNKVRATDRQSVWDPNIYLNPGNATIPQYNFRMGYFIRNHYSLSLGIDHMKYVVVQGQTVPINGKIGGTGSLYDKIYANESILIQDDFLLFEHTDGLNYINADFRRADIILDFKPVQIEYLVGLGLGALYPKTNVTLLNNARNDAFYWSGYGFNALCGLTATFYKYFFIQSEFKQGWIHLPKVRTTSSSIDQASQSFFFSQFNYVFGARFNLNKSSTSNP